MNKDILLRVFRNPAILFDRIAYNGASGKSGFYGGSYMYCLIKDRLVLDIQQFLCFGQYCLQQHITR